MRISPSWRASSKSAKLSPSSSRARFNEIVGRAAAPGPGFGTLPDVHATLTVGFAALTFFAVFIVITPPAHSITLSHECTAGSHHPALACG